TLLGQYLDPIADKLLLSTLFMVLSILHRIPWKYTVMVFGRDIAILITSAVLYAIAGLRNFSPSIFGKANTWAQITAGGFVLRDAVSAPSPQYHLHRTDCFFVVDLCLHGNLMGALRVPGANSPAYCALSRSPARPGKTGGVTALGTWHLALGI